MSQLRFLIQDDNNYMSVGTLPGTRAIITEGNSESLKVGTPDGDFELVPHDVPDKDYNPFEPGAFWGVSENLLLAATIFEAALLKYDGASFKAVKKWDTLSDRVYASQFEVATDKSGDVRFCIAADYLLRFNLEGEIPFQMIEDVNFWGLAVSHDGTRIATGREDGRLEFRNAETLEVTKELKPSQSLYLAMAFSPDGSKLVFSNDSWQLFLMDIASGEITELDAAGKVIGLHYLSDGRLVVVNLSRIVRIFDGDEQTDGWFLDKELGDRYIQGSAVLGDESGIALACEQKGLAFLPFG